MSIITYIQNHIDAISTSIAAVVIIWILVVKKVKSYLANAGRLQSIKRTQQFVDKCDDLSKHVVFQEIDDCLKFKIDSIKFLCPLRKQIFTNILKFRYARLKEALQQIAQIPKDEINSYSPADLQNKITSIFNYYSFMWKEDSKKSGIMENFLNKYSDECETTMMYFEKSIVRCIMDTRLKTLYERVISLFDCIWSVYCLFILNMKTTFDTLNGDLEHHTYNGVTCPGFDKCNKCHHGVHPHSEETK